MRISLLLILASLLLTVPALAEDGFNPAVESKISLAEALNADGTLRTGSQGSFDPKGYQMVLSATGQPVFRPAAPRASLGAGDEQWARGFDSPGTDGDVTALAADAAGNVYVAGFGGGRIRNSVGKWNGTNWEAVPGNFRVGAGGGSIYTLAVDGAGQLYAGGRFDNISGVVISNVARWNGTSWGPLGPGPSAPSGPVKALAMDGSGNVYAGGPFTQGGQQVASVGRWNGTNWQLLGTTALGTIGAMAVTSSGTVYVCGAAAASTDIFDANRCLRWTGTGWVRLGVGMNGLVESLALDAAGNLYAAGGFTSIQTGTAQFLAASRIAKWSGTTWTALGAGLAPNSFGGLFVSALLADSRGNVYAAGAFGQAGGMAAANIARWNGTSWSALSTGLGGFLPSASSLVMDSRGDLYAGGYFTTAGTAVVNRVGRWNNTTWSSLGQGVNRSVQALAVGTGGIIYAGGAFTQAGGAAGNVAGWNGATWATLGTGTNGIVSALAADTRGNLYAGGTFTQAGGVAASNIARWDGTAWTALGTGLNGRVTALTVDAGGNLYAAGFFTQAGGSSALRIAKWNGTSWSALGAGLNYGVYALAIGANGTVYAGGDFQVSGTGLVSNVVAWNGSSWVPVGTSPRNNVSALTIDGRGVLYAGGSGGYVARWSGSNWVPVGMLPSTALVINALIFDSNNNLYVGGSFSQTSGENAYRWTGSSWTLLGTGTNSFVHTMVASGGDVYVGGDFTAVGDGSRLMHHFGRYASPAGVITSLQPPAGPVGTIVTINGTGLQGATAVGFTRPGNPTVATGFAVNAAGTQLTGVVVPAGATTGNVRVTTPGGTSNGLLFTLITTTATVPTTTEILALHPNPAHETVTVVLPASLVRGPLTLLDALSRTVRRYATPAGNEVTLDLRGLPAGLYVLRGSGVGSQRLVVE